jgi:hypothetical protein
LEVEGVGLVRAVVVEPGVEVAVGDDEIEVAVVVAVEQLGAPGDLLVAAGVGVEAEFRASLNQVPDRLTRKPSSFQPGSTRSGPPSSFTSPTPRPIEVTGRSSAGSSSPLVNVRPGPPRAGWLGSSFPAKSLPK